MERKWSDRKSSNASIIGLNVFQEFHLVLILIDYFSRPGPDVTRNTVFLSLFGSSMLSPGRSKVLHKFISTAITDSIAPVKNGITFTPQAEQNWFSDFILDIMRCRHMDAASRTKCIGLFGVGSEIDRRFHNISKNLLWSVEIIANGCSAVKNLIALDSMASKTNWM